MIQTPLAPDSDAAEQEVNIGIESDRKYFTHQIYLPYDPNSTGSWFWSGRFWITAKGYSVQLLIYYLPEVL